MLFLTKFHRLSSQILQNQGCIVTSALRIQQFPAAATANLCHQVRTIMTRDPSKLDPARILLRKGPKKIKKRASTRNNPNRRYVEGDHVNANEMLRRQRVAVQWKAGQYVVTGSDRTLNAQVSGTIRFTTEYNPDKIILSKRKYFSDVLPEEEKLQTVVHIVPDEQHSRFKLVEQI